MKNKQKSEAAVISTYKELVKHQEAELNSLKAEQQRVAGAISHKDAELAQAQEEIARMRSALEDAHNNAQSRTGPPASQTDAEEQARILTSLSQAYPK